MYLHAVNSKSSIYYKSKTTLDIFEKILSSGALLSARNRNGGSSNNFCGSDYISLCDYEKRNFGKGKNNKYNGYYEFNSKSLNIVFPKGEFDVIEPVILDDKISKYQYGPFLMCSLGENEIARFSDLEDEVQVKDSISLSHMSSITLPIKDIMNYWLSVNKNIDIIKREVEKYRRLLEEYGYDVPIYDLETFGNLEDESELKDSVLTLKRK